MQCLKLRFARKFLQDELGQTAALVVVTMAGLMALSAAGMEAGHVYYAYRLLKTSTNSAALAAAQAMPDIGSSSSGAAGTAWGNLVAYSSETGQKNATSMLQNVAITATFYCSSTMSGPPFNVGCAAPPSGEGSCGGSSTCNALKVTQTGDVNLWFGGLVGVRVMHFTATASAAARGGNHLPYNIAVIIDTTASMNGGAPSSDGCGSGATQIQCAIFGAKQMMQAMYPCVGGASTACSSGSPYADAVALFAFPPVATGSSNIAKDTTCPSSNPAIVPYTFPVVPAGAGQNLILPTSGTDAGTYQIVPFNQTYKATNGATTLLSADPLAVAVGAASCNGLQAPGGDGTYYAQAIYAAQAALVAQQTSEASAGYTTLNVLIILSDGDATSGNTLANNSAGGNRSSSNQIVSLSGTLNGTCTSTSNCTNANSTTATYPSALGECGQAVQAAQAATQAGTMVYTVAMGSETSGSCLTDAQHTIASGSTYGAIAYPSGPYSAQACNAIEAMASDTNKFYSDNTGGCPASSANSTYTTIGGIFTAVGNSLTTSRLIPDGT